MNIDVIIDQMYAEAGKPRDYVAIDRVLARHSPVTIAMVGLYVTSLDELQRRALWEKTSPSLCAVAPPNTTGLLNNLLEVVTKTKVAA